MLLRRTRLENNRRCLIGSRTSSARRCDTVRVRAVHICAHRSAAVSGHTQAQVRPRSSRLHDQRLERDQTGFLRQQRSGCAHLFTVVYRGEPKRMRCWGPIITRSFLILRNIVHVFVLC